MKITRVVIGLLSASLLVLSVLAYGPFHVASGSHNKTGFHATWMFHPNSLAEARKQASAIVIARVLKVEQAADIVVKVEGEPNGEDRVPTQRITFEVVKGFKGNLKGTFTLFRTGTDTLAIEGDPAYAVGETHVLFVQPKQDEAGIYRTISPEGRFNVVDGKLQPTVHEGYAAELRGKPLAALEQGLAQAAN